MATSWIPTPLLIKDGQPVAESTTTPVLGQLIQRDQYLYEAVRELDDKSLLVSYAIDIHPSESQSLVQGVPFCQYYLKNDQGQGLARASQSLSLDEFRKTIAPSLSNYAIGIAIPEQGKQKATLYHQGRYVIPGGMQALIEPNETFRVGPYFVSRTYPGKVTANPSGVPVQMFTAIQDAQTVFINPVIDEFTQFLVSYKLNVLDKPAGSPLLTDTTWTIPTPNPSLLGWVGVNPTTMPWAPVGAKFYYQIPDNLQGDPTLNEWDIENATNLRKVLPPNPTGNNYYYVNGIMQVQNNPENPDYPGIYSITERGIFWHFDQNDFQPWSSEILSGWDPLTWDEATMDDDRRPYMILSIVKLNPELGLQLVSSIQSDASNPSLFQFLDADGNEQRTGDLTVKFNPTFEDQTGSGGLVVSDINFTDGQFALDKVPVVSTLTGISPVVVRQVTPGNFTVGLGTGTGVVLASGDVTEIEPIDTIYEYRDLMGYLRIPFDSKYGLRGKISLPKGTTVSGGKLRIYMTGFSQTQVGSQNNLSFSLQWMTSISQNKLDLTLPSRQSKSRTNVQNSIYTIPANTQAFVPVTLNDVSFSIPETNIQGDCVVAFELIRNTQPSSNYSGVFCLTSLYWAIEQD